MTETQPRRALPKEPGAWLDEGEVSPEWAPPAGDPVRPSRLRRILAYAGVPLAFALVIGLLYVTGGFGRRTDFLEPVAPGRLITTGLFELTFTEATAQRKKNFNDEIVGWEIVAIGRARTTGDEAMAPTVYGGNSLFVLKDPAAGTIVGSEGAQIGEPLGGSSISDRSNLTPGLPPTAYRVSFELPLAYRPGPTVLLGVSRMAYETANLLNDDLSWDNTAYTYVLDLPVRPLPDPA